MSTGPSSLLPPVRDEEEEDVEVEEEEDEIDDEEAEEEDVGAPPRKKSKQDAGRRFYDDEAEVSGEDSEEEEDEGEEVSGFIAKDKAINIRQQREISRMARQAELESEEGGMGGGAVPRGLEPVLARITQRAASSSSSVRRRKRARKPVKPMAGVPVEGRGDLEEDEMDIGMGEEYEDEDEEDALGEDALSDEEDMVFEQGAKALPTKHDLPLFRVPLIKQGKERECCWQLLRRFGARCMRNGGQVPDSGITSAIALNWDKGHIYVEGTDADSVRAGMQNIEFLTPWKMKLVPVNERVRAMTAGFHQVLNKLSPGQWVRIKRGTYRGDIGQFHEHDVKGESVWIKLVPRESPDISTSGGGASKGSRGKKPRPDARLFSEDQMTGRDDVLDGGFLRKRFKIDGLTLVDVVPTVSEIRQFQTSGGRDIRELLAHHSVKKEMILSTGDPVLVVAGELKGQSGVVDGVEGDVVKLKITKNNKSVVIEVEKKFVEKFFQSGKHVKVINGEHQGETGSVVHVDGPIVTVLSDLSMQNLEVFSGDLKLSSDVNTGLHSQGKFSLQDFVMIDPQTAGVVVSLTGQDLFILDMHGNLVQKSQRDVVPGRRKSVATVDKHRNEIKPGDVVRLADGPHKGKSGTIKHIFKFYVFLHTREISEHGGMCVVHSRNVLLPGGRQENGPGGRGMFAPRGGGTRGRGRGRSEGFTRDPFLFKCVRVKGPHKYKGYVGLVKDVSDEVCGVELQAVKEKIKVRKEQLVIVDSTSDGMSSSRSEDTFHPPATPYLDRIGTPMHTPMHSLSTPLRDGLATPGREAWDVRERNTPMRDPDDLFDTSFGRRGISSYPASPFHSGSGLDSEHSTTAPMSTPTIGSVRTQFESPAVPGFSTSSGSSASTQQHRLFTPSLSASSPMALQSTPFSTMASPSMNRAMETPFVSASSSSPMVSSSSSSTVEGSSQSTSNLPATLELNDWVCVGMEVSVGPTASAHVHRRGVVLHVFTSGPEITCELDCSLVPSREEEPRTLVLPLRELVPVRPDSKDECVFCAGEFKGEHGVVQTLLLGEAVVKSAEGIKLGNLSEMVKLHTSVLLRGD